MEGDGWIGELSGEGKIFLFLLEPSLGVTKFSESTTLVSEKTTVRLGVAFFRFTAFRVMSRNWRPEAVWPVLFLVVLGVKNLLKRLGVMGGGFLILLLVRLRVGEEGGGDDAKVCEE